MLKTDEAQAQYTISIPVQERTIGPIHDIRHTYDLPFGGYWYCVQMDDPKEIDLLPGWLTRGDMWLMKSELIDAWYLWVPVRGEG